MGVFEMGNFAAGTRAVMDAMVAATEAGTVTIIGRAGAFSHICVILKCVFSCFQIA